MISYNVLKTDDNNNKTCLMLIDVTKSHQRKDFKEMR